MGFREVLQTEIWSKETSRRILKIAGVSFTAIVLIVGVVVGLEVKWITPVERVAAKAALMDLDALQQSNGLSEIEYKVRKDVAEVAVRKAQGSAWTLRDERIAELLDTYRFFVDIQHDQPVRRAHATKFYELHPRTEQQMRNDYQMDAQADVTARQVIELEREVLHGVLD